MTNKFFPRQSVVQFTVIREAYTNCEYYGKSEGILEKDKTFEKMKCD